MKDIELQKQLHAYIMEQMMEEGGPSPESFCTVMALEPDLLVRYLNACGVDAKSASLGRIMEDRIQIQLEMNGKADPLSCEVRFLRPLG